MKRASRFVTASLEVTLATASVVRLLTAVIAVAALAVLVAPSAWAVPGEFTLKCAGCHTDDTPTCNGCHTHVQNQLSAQTNKANYNPGETVTVTLNLQGTPLGGGWLRAILYDQTMAEVDRVTGPTSTGDDGTGDATLMLPVMLSASAPLTPGVYQWGVGWFGHNGRSGTAAAHGELELVDTNFFSVGGATTTTTTVPGGTTTTSTLPGSTTTTTTIPGGTTTTTGVTTTTATTATTTTTIPPRTGLDHFLCYKSTFVRQDVNVTLSDMFDTGVYEGNKANMLCTPADKSGEGITDPDTHLMLFKVRGPHAPVSNVEVTNQFGTFIFDTKRTMALLVPSGKSLVPNPPPGVPGAESQVDHYRCLKARTSRGTTKFPKGLTKQVSDQFGDRVLTILKPSTLCLAVDKNDEGVKDPDAHLMCYVVKTSPRTQVSGVQAHNQLLSQPAGLDLRKEKEFCVPSTVAGVDVSVSVAGDAVPGATLGATASIHIGDGSTLQSIEWTLETEVPGVTLGGADTANATVTLPARSVYKDHLITLLSEPPIGEDQLPPNVPLPEGEFPGGLQDRFHVVGVNPFALEETGPLSLHLAVTTTSGTYTEEVDLHTALPWKTASGLLNVPVGIPVILHGKDGVTPPYDWALATKPGGSSAALADATSQNPDFTPDVAGKYNVTVTDTTANPAEVVTIEVHAGTWSGGITGQDVNGRPIAGACTGCHNGSFAPDMFTDWKETGHAEIFTNNLNTSTHYGSSCFPCHSVGYDPDVNNGGMDDASDYSAFLAAGLLNNPGDNWTTVLASFPNTAKRANIQCENCHGPQNSTAHAAFDPRMSLSSNVCGVCHGEPLRHARFQQWQLSAHANYEVAVDESQSGDCSRCHTGNGFLAWMDVDNDAGTNVAVTWTEDEAHPQTCATCHDPHAIGTVSGNNTNATVRISGDTTLLVAGFTATDVGKGALCMTCHNSRRGLRNDSKWDDIAGTSDAARASHGGPQTDVVMGENLYLVTVPARGPHSLTSNAPDTCVTCHMEATPPPDALAYNQGGTNHTFYARPDICGECHGFDSAQGVQNPVEGKLHDLEGAIEAAILQLMADQITAGNVIDLNGDATPDITDVGLVQEIAFGESRGRQAITVTFTDLTTVGPRPLSDIDVLDGTTLACPAPLTRCELYDFADPSLPKAGWNYTVIHNDGSKGVHNPGFVFSALDNSIAALTP